MVLRFFFEAMSFYTCTRVTVCYLKGMKTTANNTRTETINLETAEAAIRRPVHGADDASEHGRELRVLEADLLREADARFELEPYLYQRRMALAGEAGSAAAFLGA